ncbi:MAG: alpha-glucan family phosphorylase [Planctomycetota bacterium]|nr:MAG: alpha-glucan family phosphorylase [Planctomycetota bacterium]
MHEPKRVAYFSMEIGLDARIPTYSGGLGVLAGDTVRAAADLGLPFVAVTLLYRKGYFRQILDAGGNQAESPAEWAPEQRLEELRRRVRVTIEGRGVQLRAWKLEVAGVSGRTVPVYFLDADLPANADADRRLTDHLYGGDARLRLSQEVVLGMGGVRLLRALGHDRLDTFHLNEGHAALVTFELLAERLARAGRENLTAEDVAAVRALSVFTTHTPVAYGHDRFPVELVRKVIGRHPALRRLGLFRHDGQCNMTVLALNLSRYVNAVARRHGEVSRRMFPRRAVDSITNGVHALSWTAPPFRRLYDRWLPGWRGDAAELRLALRIPRADLAAAHRACKLALRAAVARLARARLDPAILTLGFARRATGYKRADLLFADPDRLRRIASRYGGLQAVFAGKAHPLDVEGKDMIRRVHAHLAALHPAVRAVYLPDYDLRLGRLLTSGVDVWLNTPEPPLEASGTSGMKAALNGVPSLSILDGWWLEGWIEGTTGWRIGADAPDAGPPSRARDAAALYDQLENAVARLYYRQPDRFLEVRANAIAINGAYFNTHRMLGEYVRKAYYGTNTMPSKANRSPGSRSASTRTSTAERVASGTGSV